MPDTCGDCVSGAVLTGGVETSGEKVRLTGGDEKMPETATLVAGIVAVEVTTVLTCNSKGGEAVPLVGGTGEVVPVIAAGASWACVSPGGAVAPRPSGTSGSG